jgi:competence protein ComGC
MEREPVESQSGTEAVEQKPKVCKRARLSIIYGLLGFLTFGIGAVAGLEAGIKALKEIRRSEGRLFGKVYAIAGICISGGCILMLLASIIIPAFAHERTIRNRFGCGDNLFAIGRAISDYANDHNGRYPSVEKWCDMLVEGGYIRKEQLKCPGDKHGPCSYAMNPNAEPNSPDNMVVLFEAKGGWNQYGGPELWNMENHEDEGCNALFNDWHVEFIHHSRDNITQIMWKVEDSNGG